MAAERSNEAFSQLKYYCVKLLNSQAIDSVTVPASLTTRDPEDTSPLEDTKDVYKTQNETPLAWVEIKSPPEILNY